MLVTVKKGQITSSKKYWRYVTILERGGTMLISMSDTHGPKELTSLFENTVNYLLDYTNRDVVKLHLIG